MKVTELIHKRFYFFTSEFELKSNFDQHHIFNTYNQKCQYLNLFQSYSQSSKFCQLIHIQYVYTYLKTSNYILVYNFKRDFFGELFSIVSTEILFLGFISGLETEKRVETTSHPKMNPKSHFRSIISAKQALCLLSENIC